MSEACNKSRAHSVSGYRHDNGNSHRGGFGGLGSRRSKGYENINVEMNELVRQVGEPVILAVAKAVLDDQIFSFDISEIAKSRADRVNIGSGTSGRS